MPYHVGKKGSYGCSGYPALKDDGTVMGCHKTAEEAANQIYAINQSEGNIDKSMYSVRENFPGCSGYAVVDEDGELDGCFSTREEAEAYVRAENQDEDDDKGIGIKDPEEMPASTKASPCWDGYVQRGMKPGENGGMVPNCVPVAKAIDIDLFSDFGKDYTKTRKETYRVGE
jgi:hypothetical protein